MLEVALADINTLPYPAVSPTDNPILNQLLAEIQELRSEVAQLREERKQDRQEIQDLREKREKDRAEFERFKQTHKTFAIQTTNDIDQLFEAAEKKEPEPEEPKSKRYTSKVATHLNDIYDALQDRVKSYAKSAQKWDFMAYWEAEELLDLSHRRISQLAEIARNDPRFIIGWHPKKPNMKVFRLNPFTLGNIAHMAHGAFKSSKNERVDALLNIS